MKRFRFLSRLITAFLIRHKKILLAGFIAGAISVFLIPKFFKIIPERKYTQTIGIVGRYTTSEIPDEVLNLISIGLTKVSQDGTPVPHLAESWSISEDGRQYKFVLKELTWQDGTPLVAKDINYNFKDVQIGEIDQKTITFILKEPFSPFPVIVSKPIFKKGLLGLGEYRVKKITNSGKYIDSILLVTNELRSPNLNYKFYPTEESAKIALKLGEIRELKGITSKEGLESWKNIEITPKILYNRYVGIFFNTASPFLEDKTFRQALSYALEKPQGETKAYGPISPLSWAYNNDVKTYDYDLENAKKLFSKTIEGKKDVIKIKISTGASLLNQAEIIKNSWEKLGLKVDIKAFTSIDEGFDVLLATQEVPEDPDQYSLWHSTQETNISNFKNLRIDKLLEDGRIEQDRTERQKIYFDFQRFLVEEEPVIFLYHPIVFDVKRI